MTASRALPAAALRMVDTTAWAGCRPRPMRYTEAVLSPSPVASGARNATIVTSVKTPWPWGPVARETATVTPNSAASCAAWRLKVSRLRFSNTSGCRSVEAQQEIRRTVVESISRPRQAPLGEPHEHRLWHMKPGQYSRQARRHPYRPRLDHAKARTLKGVRIR